MSSKTTNEDPMLKIILCEEDDLADSPVDGPPKKCDKYEIRAQSSRLATVRKQNGVRSANYVLASNPYQRKGNCANCQSMQNAKNNVSPFTQKIMSAKLLRFKQMQNQISEMSLKINELMSENKILKTLQRRQDNALKKYEGSKEQLPQLIKNHNEEVRVINQKFKQLKAAHRELENKMKQKDSELTNLREQHSHLLQLSRDKQLFERDKLTKKLASLELYSKEQNDKIITLQRKLELQEKNFKHQLQLEIQKHRDTQAQLLNVRQMNDFRVKEGQEKVRSPRKIVGLGNYDSYHSHNGSRSRASLPSPARQVVIEGQRTTMSDMANKTSYSSGANTNKDHEEDSDSAHEEETNIKVSVKRSNLVRRNPARNQGRPAPKESPRRKVSQSALTEDLDNKTNGGHIPVRVTVSSNQSEDVPKTAVSEVQNEDRKPVDSPRFTHYRAGISIPSDLTIGNAARMRAVSAIPSSEESATSDDEADTLQAPPVTELPDSDVEDSPDPETSRNTLRARTEEDIDKIISKACDDMLANDVEHESIMNGIGNFSLSEEISQLKELSWDELHKQIKPMRDEMTKKLEKADYTLEPNEKNHLLKALNLIDEESQPAEKFMDSNYIPTEPEKRQSVRQMFAQNRKKVDLMKSLFGSDPDPIPVSDGIN